MVVIRLARFGKKNHPTYRLVVSDKQKDTKGTYLEQVGVYDPHTSPATLTVKADRIKYWVGVGAQPSPTVHNLLVDQKLIDAPKLVIARAKKSAEPKATETPKTEAPAETPAAGEPKAETPAASPAEAAPASTAETPA